MKYQKLYCLMCVLSISIIIILCGCQSNPENPAVISKNDGSFDRNAAVSASETHAPDATQAAKYSDTFTSTDGSVEYVVSIDETITGADMPVVEVTPHFLTEEDARRVAETIFGEKAIIYEGEPSFQERFSQEEISQQISRWSQYTTAEALGAIYRSGNLEEDAKTVRDYLEYLSTEVYPTAPTGDFRQKCQWTFHKDSYYYGTETAASMDTSEDNDQIKAWIRDGDFFFDFTASTRNKNDFKLNNIYAHPLYLNPLMLDYEILKAQHLRTDPPTQEQVTAVMEKAQNILDSIELGEWKVDCGTVKAVDDGGETEYSIQVSAVPIFGGVPVLRSVQISSLKSKEATASNYYLTDANFTFSPGGKLMDFSLYSPVDVNEILNENVKTMTVEQLLARAKDHLSLTDSQNYADPWLFENFSASELQCTVNIRELQYGLTRVKVPDTDEAYYYLPAVTLSGSIEFTGKEDGKIYSQSIGLDGGNTVKLLTLNAVDGTVIP